MATVNAKGLASASATAQAEGAITHGASGLSSDSAVSAFGGHNLIHGASGLANAAATALGRFVRFPKLVSAVVISPIRIRLTFDTLMKKDAALILPANYDITTTTPGAIAPTINSIEPENVASPDFIELVTGEHTDAAAYEVTVVSGVGNSGPTDSEGTEVDTAADSDTYTGVGDFPDLKEVVSISENRADAVFDENMKDNPDIRNPAKYTWDNGLTTLSVLSIQDDTVQLVTSNQVPGLLYTLTVLP